MEEGNDGNILCGPEIPLETSDATLGQVLFARLKSHNPYDVLMCEAESGKTITPAEFLKRSVNVAERLRRRDLVSGDVVCIMGRASINAYSVATGTLFQGGIVFPLDHTLPSDVFQLILTTAEPKFIFCDADIGEEVAEAVSHLENQAAIILLNQTPEVDTGFESFEEFIKIKVNVRVYEPALEEDPGDVTAFMVCSSGTTGLPKPVMLTNRNFLYQISVWSFFSTFNKLLLCPAITFSFFFWISGVMQYLLTVALGFEMTIVQKLEAHHVLQIIERHKPVWGMFSPALLKFLTLSPDFKTFNVSSLSYIVTGGCSLDRMLVEKVKELWGGHVICKQTYGQTEVGGSATNGVEEDILSAGRLLPFFKLKVVDPFDGSILGPGQKGEIYLTSPSLMKGYRKNPEATAAVLHGNWIKTGDFGYYTKEGLIYICGRVRDLIKVKGALFSPVDLEEIISTIPGILDVGVVGIKVDKNNAVPMALVVKGKGISLSEEEIVNHVNGLVEEHKQLRGGVRFVDSIPRTASGKMKRAEILSIAEALYEEE